MRRIVFAATVSAVALLAGSSLAQTSQLAVGASVTGALNDSDPTRGSEDDGQYRYEDYKVSVRRGQRLEAVLRSEAFDAYLQVFAPGQDGDDGEALAESVRAWAAVATIRAPTPTPAAPNINSRRDFIQPS